MQGTLRVLPGMQLDGEWLLILTEDDHIAIARRVSALEHGPDSVAALPTETRDLLRGGVRGIAFGAVQA